jgi:hypothetical protein
MHAAVSTARAVMITGRRPTWSDREPRIRTVIRRNTTYTTNTAVSVVAENPHRAW